MNRKPENNIKSESEQRFMDALLKEHYSANGTADAEKIQDIINKARSSVRLRQSYGGNRIYFFRFLSAAALLAFVAGLLFYMKNTGGVKDKDAMSPFLLVAENSSVIAGKNNGQFITGAKRLSREEEIKVADNGSAFVIFPDLTKIEVAAQSQLHFKELNDTTLPAWKRNSIADKEIFFDNGIFRIEANVRATVLKSDYGSILSGNSKIILMVTPEICYVEVCRGTIYFSGNGTDKSALKVSQDNCLIVKPGQSPVIMRKNDLHKTGNDEKEIAGYKHLLINDKVYDNILINLMNKNAADICLNKEFLRSIMKDIR